MAYGKKPTKSYKPKMSKRKTYAKSAPSAALTRQVRQIVNKQAETKSHIVVGTEVTVSSLGSPAPANIIVLNFIAQSDAINGRSGNKITPTFLNVRGALHLSPDAATMWVRMLIIEHDVSDDFATDGCETDLATFASTATDVSAIFARYNTTKYRILANQCVKLGHTQGYFGSKLFNMNVKLKGNMYFDQGQSIPTKRRIDLVVYNRRCDNDESLGTSLEMSYNSKFYYTDV